MKFSREWAMPNSDTFSIKCIRRFVERWKPQDPNALSVDPFARNSRFCTLRNDLNPSTEAEFHMDASDFLLSLHKEYLGKICFAIIDPPYSVRQIAECYKGVGKEVTNKDTRCDFWPKVKKALLPILTEDAIVLSFGWNSCGMGKKMGFEQKEILLVAAGGNHNDTICLAEQRIPNNLAKLFEPIL